MKKLSVLLTLAMFMATSAFAIQNYEDNILGLYWDTEADVACNVNSSGVLHLILTHPTMGDLYGVECGWDYQDGAVAPAIYGKVWAATGVQDFGTGDNDIYAGFGAPLLAQETTLILSMNVMDLGGLGLSFFMKDCDTPSIPGGLPVVLGSGDILYQVGVNTIHFDSSYFPEAATATLGLACVVATEGSSWGSVKSLYR